MSPPDLQVVERERDAAPRAADLIAAAAREAVAERGSFALAVSGGRTPWGMLAILSDHEDMPWAETTLFQVDERVAAPGSQERNLTHIVLALSMEHQAAIRPQFRPRLMRVRASAAALSASISVTPPPPTAKP